jgi:hypothetical protein
MRFNAAPFFTDPDAGLSIYFLKGFSYGGTTNGSDHRMVLRTSVDAGSNRL